MTQGLRVRALFVGAVLLAVGGCATNTVQLPYWFTGEQKEAQDMPDRVAAEDGTTDDAGIYYRQDSHDMERELATGQSTEKPLYRTPPNLYSPMYTHKSLSDYAEQLAMELIRNARGLNMHSHVGVASFVALDDSLQRSNMLGNQLAELMIREVQQFGVAVVDFKTADVVNVQRTGDFVFSRDASELAQKLALDHILSGTLIEDEQGVRVNARIVAMSTKVVVASASIMVPAFMVEQLAPNYVLAE